MRVRVLMAGLRSLIRFKLRTAFMMVGAFVGVAALTLVVSVGDSIERRLLSTIRQLFGTSSIVITARGTTLMTGPRSDAARLTIDDIEAVAAAVPEVELWDPQQSMQGASVRRGDAVTTARVLGQSERSERAWSRSVHEGNYFDAAAVRDSDRVALVGDTVARALFPDGDPVGADIQIGSVVCRVVGVLERLGTDIHGMDRDNEIVVPITTLQRRLMNVDTIGAAKILVRTVSRSETTAAEIRQVLRERHALAEGQPDDFTILTPVGVQAMAGTVQRILVLYLPLVAGIALVVGAIVAATLMVSSVNARLGELGVRLAVGARPADLFMQLLVETAATMMAGGVLGTLIGYGGARLAAERLKLGAVFSWKAVGLGLTISLLAGVVAGVVPAMRAAKLPPADALR
jgi:putative ABC transport system permease protein